LLQPLAMGGLVIVFVIMILIDWEDLRDRVLRLAGRRDLHRTTEAMNDAAERVSRYLRRQLIVNLTCGVPIGVGLTVIGIPNAALWAIFVVFLRFVPYLGIIIATSFPLALSIAVAPGWTLFLRQLRSSWWSKSPSRILWNLGSTGSRRWPIPGSVDRGRSVLDMAVGTHRAIVVDPADGLSCCARRHVRPLRFLHVMLGNDPVLTPEETFYQRLLANDS
jgi:AI-2E family transporter